MIAWSIVPNIPGLPAEFQGPMREMWEQLFARRHRNVVRRKYFDYKATLKDLGISIPPHLRGLETVLGWPAKGVEGLVKRTSLLGFTTPDGVDPDSLGLTMLWDDNRLEAEAGMAHTSAAVSSCAFGFVNAGNVDEGDPEAVITLKSAEWATGIWDRRRRRLSAALSVIDVEKDAGVSRFNLYFPGLVIACRRVGTRWDVRRIRHELGMPVEVLPFKPSLDRPFGKSRISRAVMGITDSGVRTLVRSEVSAEFFSAPQRYALGADDEAFVNADGTPIPAWQSLIGRILAIGRDEEGDIPTIGQFAQQSFEPHFAQVRQLASMVASEFNMTPRSFGIMQDNPESADAIIAAKEDLVLDVDEWRKHLSPAWRRLIVAGLRLLDDTPAAREVYRSVRPRWGNPATPSVVSASAALVQQATVLPWLGQSDVAIEALGYPEDQAARLRADRDRFAGQSTLTSLLTQPAGPQPGTDEPSNAADLKEKFEALGIAVRAGIDPADAAERLGLTGVRLTGAVPVSLRMPEREATDLEER